jgi:soluble lytic murein transglycosylase
MRSRFAFHQSGGDYRGRVSRRADRYQQDDTRGQYPRPRDNRFAQSKPRVMPPSPAPPPEQSPAREPEPPREVYAEGGAQYQKPARPYVPEYMKAAREEAPQEFAPVRQEDYIARQNPYVVVSETEKEPAPKMKQRTLIALVAVAVVLLAGVLVSRLIFISQTEAVFAARAAAAEIVEQRHPFHYQELIEREAYDNNLHPAFVAAIVLNESSFNPGAVSSRGARGLMQMMPDTAEWVFGSLNVSGEYSFDLMFDAEMNVEFGCWYLNYLSEKFGGDPVLVAAAFHAGQTTVENWLSNEEYSSDQRTIALDDMYDGNTKAYVEKVLNAFAVYRRLYYEEVTV